MTLRRQFGIALLTAAALCALGGPVELLARHDGSPAAGKNKRPLADVPGATLVAWSAICCAAGLVVYLALVRNKAAPEPWPPPDPTGTLGSFRCRFPEPPEWQGKRCVAPAMCGAVWLAAAVAIEPGDIRTTWPYAALFAPAFLASVWFVRRVPSGPVDLFDGGFVVRGNRGAAVRWEAVASLSGMTQGPPGKWSKARPLRFDFHDGTSLCVPHDLVEVHSLAAVVYAAVLPLQMERARAAIRRGEPVTCAGLRVDAGGATRPGGGRLEWRHVGRVALERGRFLVEVRDGRVWWRVDAETTPDVLLFAALAAELRFGGPPADREFA